MTKQDVNQVFDFFSFWHIIIVLFKKHNYLDNAINAMPFHYFILFIFPFHSFSKSTNIYLLFRETLFFTLSSRRVV